ncbi:MAG: ABC transporter permease subunit [Clostridia bacterium]|nr:ABC transporter permease subunit [Clostridia bacterium]MBQ8399550.1 ABC transporter permease subunit [Clostridia bacterium]
MTLFFHELKRNSLSLMVWSGAIAFMLAVCVFIYPEMASQMGELGDMFADMGSFSEAFGMDQLNFGEFMGYFAIECGNTLGLGGALFAAIIGMGALAKEERDHTAELLLTLPVSRTKVVAEKFGALLVQILVLNLVVVAAVAVSVLVIGEEVSLSKMALLFLAYVLLQIELACITFGISAFIKRGGLGIGIGLALLLYFVNILSNLTEDAEFLKYITPFGYADGSQVIANGAIEIKYLLVGAVFALLGVLAAFLKYNKKDIS